jgi:pimeloyl-ACP methyl ester carboxylesterase
LLLRTWRIWGVHPELFQMNWADSVTFNAKFVRLLTLIDTLADKGYEVSLVGASAGAGAAINAFAERKDKIRGVVCIAGKINNPESIGPRYRSQNASFVESAYLVPASLKKLDVSHDRPRILSLYGILDEIVPTKDSIIPGAHNRKVLTAGHAMTIATQLLFGAPLLLRFLKRL